MAPLSLGRTLLRRFAIALLVPALLWSPLAALVGGFDLEVGLIFEAVLWAMSAPFSLFFAGWMPALERLSLEGGVMGVRWWSLGEHNEAYPLGGLQRLAVHGRSLHIRRRGLPAVTVRLPWGSEAVVRDWVAQVDAQLATEEGLEPEQGSLPDELDRTVVAQTHDGVRLRFGSVHQPLPPAFAALGLTAFWGMLLPVAVAMSGALDTVGMQDGERIFASLLLLAGGLLGTALATWATLRQIRSVELALSGPLLKITIQKMVGAEHRTLPLADLRGVEQIGGKLYLRTREGRVHLPLPARSRGTVEALHGFLAEHIEQSEHLQGQVAPELDVLLRQGGRREAARERQRD
jgi:hypothetical protein